MLAWGARIRAQGSLSTCSHPHPYLLAHPGWTQAALRICWNSAARAHRAGPGRREVRPDSIPRAGQSLRKGLVSIQGPRWAILCHRYSSRTGAERPRNVGNGLVHQAPLCYHHQIPIVGRRLPAALSEISPSRDWARALQGTYLGRRGTSPALQETFLGRRETSLAPRKAVRNRHQGIARQRDMRRAPIRPRSPTLVVEGAWRFSEFSFAQPCVLPGAHGRTRTLYVTIKRSFRTRSLDYPIARRMPALGGGTVSLGRG
jgi:hypothetical protein